MSFGFPQFSPYVLTLWVSATSRRKRQTLFRGQLRTISFRKVWKKLIQNFGASWSVKPPNSWPYASKPSTSESPVLVNSVVSFRHNGPSPSSAVLPSEVQVLREKLPRFPKLDGKPLRLFMLPLDYSAVIVLLWSNLPIISVFVTPSPQIGSTSGQLVKVVPNV